MQQVNQYKGTSEKESDQVNQSEKDRLGSSISSTYFDQIGSIHITEIELSWHAA